MTWWRPSSHRDVPTKIENAVLFILVLASCPGRFTAAAEPTLLTPRITTGYILGADISWVQQQEDEGRRFSDHEVPKDILVILKEHGFNWIRLRIFYDPKTKKGYSSKGYCDLPHTLQMAKRTKATGMGFLLDFHYSDTLCRASVRSTTLCGGCRTGRDWGRSFGSQRARKDRPCSITEETPSPRSTRTSRWLRTIGRRTADMDRRRFLGALTTHLVRRPLPQICSVAIRAKPYTRANTDWLAKCRYGVGVHWTAQTVPRQGSPLPFQKAVDAFDVKRFVGQLAYAGADYLLFTSAHALQMLPAPHPVIDKILPGRTCKRDLIAELADALAAKGMPLLVYYNHSCNRKDRPVLGARRSDTTAGTKTVLPRTSWRSSAGWASGTRTRSRRGGSTARIPSIPVARTTASPRT